MDFKLKEFKMAITVSRIANIHYFEFTKEYHTTKDSHAFRELVYVDNGEISVEAENYKGILKEGMMIIHKTGETHSLRCINNTAPNVIIIGFECDSERLDVFSGSAINLNSALQKILTEIIKEGRSVFEGPYDIPNLRDMKKKKDYPFGADQMIKLKLETFLIELVRSSEAEKLSPENEAGDRNLSEICSYLKENFREKITLSELCFIFGTNKTTLCSMFKKATGDTVIGYINALRIKEAKKLMREGNYNLSEIASILRFSSLHYFSRLFKKMENISPSDYIRTIKSRLDM